jgi:hypothetical protein
MATRGSAVLSIGLNTSAFTAGARVVLNMQKTLAAGFASVARTAAGVATGIGMTRFVSQLSRSVTEVTELAREFDNIKAASGVIASQVQAMRFSREQRVSFSTAQDLLGDSGKVWDKYAGAIRDASVRWAAASERAQAAWAAIIGEIAPVFSRIMEDFRKVDLIGMAQKFGRIVADSLKFAYELFSNNALLQQFGENLKTIILDGAANGFAAFTNAAVTLVKNMWTNGLNSALGNMFSSFVKFADLSALYLKNMWLGVINSLEEKWNRLLLTLNGFASNLGFGNSDAMWKGHGERQAGTDRTSRGLGYEREFLKAQMSMSLQGVQDALTRFSAEILKASGNTPQAFKSIGEMFSKAVSRFDTFTGSKGFDIENRSVGQTFAATSLAAIGGGGYTGPTSLQTMADNSRRQTDLQTKINDQLTVMVQMAAASVNPLAAAVNGGRSIQITNFQR